MNKPGQQIEVKTRPQHASPLDKKSECHSHSRGRPWPRWSARRSPGGLERHSTNPRIHCNRKQERMRHLKTTYKVKHTEKKPVRAANKLLKCDYRLWKLHHSKASMTKIVQSNFSCIRETRTLFARTRLAQTAGYRSIKPGISSIKSLWVLQGCLEGEQGLCPNGILITPLKLSTCLNGPN